MKKSTKIMIVVFLISLLPAIHSYIVLSDIRANSTISCPINYRISLLVVILLGGIFINIFLMALTKIETLEWSMGFFLLSMSSGFYGIIHAAIGLLSRYSCSTSIYKSLNPVTQKLLMIIAWNVPIIIGIWLLIRFFKHWKVGKKEIVVNLS